VIRKKAVKHEIVVDLTGPDGNAFVLLGKASRWARDLGLDFERIHEEATSGDYENLVSVLDNYFGDFIVFER